MRRIQKIVCFVGLMASVAASTSCGSVVGEGRTPVFLVMESMTGKRGGGSADFGVPLVSDVVTGVTTGSPSCTPTSPCPTVFSDNGKATMRAVLKNAGGAGTDPSPINDVTITRFHVRYLRMAGTSVEGVDVPFGLDGVTNVTVSTSSTDVPFQLVSINAKLAAPLLNLVTNGGVLTVTGEVTFYGHDQRGNEVEITGYIQIDFGDFS